MTRRLALLCVVLWAPACIDETHDLQVAALGGEVSGVPPGPLHRAGQPCLTCHGGSGPASSEFSIGGTAYLLARSDDPANGAFVQIYDALSNAGQVYTNQAGNFYITIDEWQPLFPIHAMTVTLAGVQKQMTTIANRSGSCADCHTDQPDPTSPGHVYVATNPSDFTSGGMNP